MTSGTAVRLTCSSQEGHAKRYALAADPVPITTMRSTPNSTSPQPGQRARIFVMFYKVLRPGALSVSILSPSEVTKIASVLSGIF